MLNNKRKRKYSDEIVVKLEGHVKITEYLTPEDLQNGKGHRVWVNKRNAVHQENASILLARGMADRASGAIFSMSFGTGGATIDPLGNVVFVVPNTTGAADLNKPVFTKVVDDLEGAPIGNSLNVRHINGTLFSDVEIRCVVDQNEPFGQPAFDNVGIVNVNSSNFVFSEIGLKTQDGLLVTHVVFSPVEKTANRIFEVVYTIRVRLS